MTDLQKKEFREILAAFLQDLSQGQKNSTEVLAWLDKIEKCVDRMISLEVSKAIQPFIKLKKN